ncbi:MAG: GNA1162 family protein [Elusimicrobiota bacterium]|jgi:tetratricopeptide (TPR) repeat protein
MKAASLCVLLLLASSAPGIAALDDDPYAQLGGDAFKAEDVEGAIKSYEKAFEKAETDEDRAEAAKSLGIIYLRVGDRPQARSHFQTAVELAPRNADYQYLAALLRDDPAEQIQAFEKILKIAPDHLPTLVELGATYQTPSQRRWDLSIDLLGRALKLAGDPQTKAMIALGLAGAHRQAGRLPETIQWLRFIVRELPDSDLAPRAAFEAGMELRQDAASRVEAARLVRRACEGFSKRPVFTGFGPDIQRTVASECAGRGFYGLADLILDGLMKTGSSDSWLLLDRAFVDSSRGRLERAQGHLQTLLATVESSEAPETFLAYQMLMDILKEKDDRDAMDALVARVRTNGAKIVRRHPESGLAYASLAVILATRGSDLDSAGEALRRSLALRPGTDGQFARGRVLLAQGRGEEAVDAFKRSISTVGFTSAGTYWYLGKAFRAAGKQREAQRAWRKGLQINPRSRRILAELGRSPPPDEETLSLPAEGAVREPTPSRRGSGGIPRIAVLPLDNRSNDLDAAGTARYWLHERLARRGFEVLPLELTDRLLREKLGITDGGQLKAVSARQLGAALEVGGIVYVVLEENTRANVGFARKEKTALSLRLVDAKSGREHWSGSGAASEGEIALSARKAAGVLQDGLLEALEQKTGDPLHDRKLMEAVRKVLVGFPRGPY